MTREKRSFTRITLDIPASLSLYQMETYHIRAITNISLGGCFFPFEDELPLKEPCYVTITVGEGLKTEKVTVAGMIARSDSQGVGINFTDKSLECKVQLVKIIAHVTAK
jgi:hypothetical protein